MYYDKTMRHVELHFIETAHDLASAELAGLDVYEDDTCDTCHEPIGEQRVEKFVPFVILLDDEQEWVVCADCAEPVL